MGTLQVEIVEIDGAVWSGEATSVIARTHEGDLGILAGHAPLMGLLTDSEVVRVKRPGGLEDIVVAAHGGSITVVRDQVTILAESAELAGDIDVERARAALERAKAGGESREARAAESRATTRLRVVGKL